MDVLPGDDRRPVRLIGNGGSLRARTAMASDEERDRSLLDDQDEPVGFEFDDDWPPHFGAARVGIP